MGDPHVRFDEKDVETELRRRFLFHIRFVGCIRCHSVHQAAIGIDADMGLPAEIPLLALFV